MDNVSIFGESPYIKQNTVHTEINNTVYYVFAIVIIILTIYLIYLFCTDSIWNNNDTYRDKIKEAFESINGDAYDDTAKSIIHYGRLLQNPTAIDHYRIGSTYLINAKNYEKAYEHFNKALSKIINNFDDAEENEIHNPFIIDRIDEYKDLFIEEYDIKDLPLQEALLLQFTNIKNNIKENKILERKLKSEDPQFTQKYILSKQLWETDSQNVHDKSLYNNLLYQYEVVVSENSEFCDNNDFINTYDKVKEYYLKYYEDDDTKLKNVNMVFDKLDKNHSISILNNIGEKKLISVIWNRIHDIRNVKNISDLKMALGESINDCIEGGYVVCITGRTAKLWQSLAKIDIYPYIGVLKNKQTIKNEIYQKCAKIVNDHIGENSDTSEELINAYNNSEDTEQVKELIKNIKNDIDLVYNDYKEIMDNNQLKLIIEECKLLI